MGRYSNMILTDENLNLKVAASIQFKHFILKNPEVIHNFTLEDIITVIVQSPPLVKIQLIPVLNRLTQFLILNGSTEQLIQSISDNITSSPTNAFCSILIMRGLIKIENYIIPGIGTIDNLAQILIPYFPIILQILQSLNPFDSNTELFFHYGFLTANIFINYCPLEPFGEWINFLSSFILTLSNSPNSNNKHYPFLDKDAIKLICSIFNLLFNSLSFLADNNL